MLTKDFLIASIISIAIILFIFLSIKLIQKQIIKQEEKKHKQEIMEIVKIADAITNAFLDAKKHFEKEVKLWKH